MRQALLYIITLLFFWLVLVAWHRGYNKQAIDQQVERSIDSLPTLEEVLLDWSI